MRFKLSSKFVRGFFYAPQMSRKKKKRSLKQVSKQNNVKKYRLEICQSLETRILPRIVKFQVQGDQRVANKRRNNRLPVYISGDAFSCFSFTVTARHDDVYDIYIYIRGPNLPPAWKEREKKRRSCRQLSANRRGSFTRFFLPPRRFILRVVAFFFANSNEENGLYKAEVRYRQFSCARFDFFYALPYVYHYRPPTYHSTSEDLRNYRPTLSPFLFYSCFFFILLVRSSEGTMFFLLILIKWI